MSCEQALSLMSASMDGELSPEQETLLQAHLDSCPDCRRVMEAMKGLDLQVSALQEPAPEGLKKGVLYRIDQATGRVLTPRRRWFGPGTAVGAVAAVLVLLVGLGVIPLKQKAIIKDADSVGGKSSVPAVTAAPEAPQRDDLPEADDNDSYFSPLPAAEPNNSVDESPPPSHVILSPENIGSINSSGTGSFGKDEQTRNPQQTSSALHDRCAALSRQQDAMVLLYTDFSKESLSSVLETSEPKLYSLIEQLGGEEQDGLVLCKTNCGSALAIQEWLLNHLPSDETADPSSVQLERQIRSRMEALDPGSSNLYKVISFPERPNSNTEISWPDSVPADWADRFRAEQNWELFFPSEQYVPNSEKSAYLVFAEAN